MGCRMLCTCCFETRRPDTVLEGSDLAEMLSWLCFALPGWLYCAWRHAIRTRVCAVCGSASLVRETRAASRRAGAPAEPTRVRNAAGPIRWPHALEHPRDRLWHGGVAVVLVLGLALGSAASAHQPPTIAWPLVGGPAAAWGAWLLYQVARVLRSRAAACWAWDERGHPLRIEALR